MVKHYVITLTTGTDIQLSSALAVGETDHQCAAIWLQPRGTNAAVTYIGSADGVTSTNYGVRLEAGAAGIPPAPFNAGEFAMGHGPSSRSPHKLSDFWVLGTTGDFLHVLVVYY